MRLAATIARYLLGLMFTVFGANGFLHFIPQPPPTNPVAIPFWTAVTVSHFFVGMYAVQLVCGVLLLVGRFVPLALTFLAGVIYNILMYHLTMDPKGLPPGVLATVLWLVVFLRYRASFRGILGATAAEPA